jgi:acyl dehydratase
MSVERIKGLVGVASAPGEWLTVTQDMINIFAELTGDAQWIHVDADRCRSESPYGTTIAHGMLIQSLIPKLLGKENTWLEGFSAGINYGSDKVRFSSPVRAGDRIRGHWSIKSVNDAGSGSARVVIAFTIKIDGQDKPACYAELVGLLYP